MTSFPLGLIVLEGVTGLRETLFTSVLKEVMEDTDENPDEEIHGARSRRVLSAGALSHGFEVHQPLGYGCVHQPTSSLNPRWWGFLWRLPRGGIISC